MAGMLEAGERSGSTPEPPPRESRFAPCYVHCRTSGADRWTALGGNQSHHQFRNPAGASRVESIAVNKVSLPFAAYSSFSFAIACKDGPPPSHAAKSRVLQPGF